MAPGTLADLLAYCAQVACVALVAGVVPAVVRLERGAVRYAYWRASAALCLALPWLQFRPRAAGVTGTVSTQVTNILPSSGPINVDGGVAWTSIALAVAICGILVRLAWMIIGLARLRHLRASGCGADEYGHLHQLVNTRADVRYVPGLPQPVTFGWRDAVILLPDRLRDERQQIRDAVVLHELYHVHRHDWLWLCVEEAVRAVFWFHLPMVWLISRIQHAREEVVDACVVRATGLRRAYVEALMAFADRGPSVVVPAASFGRRRHLFRRIVLISREGVMSKRRIAVSCAAMSVVVLAASWFAMGAFPLGGGVHASQLLQSGAGPLERAARPITPENPIPERIHYTAPEYPDLASQENAFAYVTLRITVDASGSVAEARLFGFGLKTDRYDVRISPSEHAQENVETFLEKATLVPRGGTERIAAASLRPMMSALIDAAAAGVQQWRYAPPVDPPISFDVSISFAPAGGGVATGTSGSFSAGWSDAIRVNGTIKPPTKIKDVRPTYPDDAREAKVQGIVILDVKIDEFGHVADTRVLRSIPMLDQAAVDAVKQWEFTPTLLNGVATPVAVTVTVSFTLK